MPGKRPTKSVSSPTTGARRVARPATQSQPAVRAPQRKKVRTGSHPQSSAPPTPGAGSELKDGQLFAKRYRIVKRIGKGGMGAVYLAQQEPLSRMVAIKILHGTADETTVARFQREARLIAQLQHPHIVGLIDFGDDHGRLYLVMEYIDGDSLTNVMADEAPFEPQRVVNVALQIAEALAVAHDMQVVHRDVKPDNIMLLETAGGQDFVKMLDFGVAKIKKTKEGDGQNTVETKAGLIVGSLRYISPEQVENGEITPRTDMYSFGCVVYEMLAGRRVFEYASPADCAIAHITEDPPIPEIGGKELEGPLVDFIMKCLEKKSENRPANAREAIAALQECKKKPLTLRGSPPPAAIQDLTMQQAPGGIDAAQSASTIAIDKTSIAGRANPPRAEANPKSGLVHMESRRLDAPIRRPTAAQRYEIMGADHTSTHLGVRVNTQTGMRPRRQSRWWLWLLAGIVAMAAGFTIVMLVATPSKSGPEATVPVEGSTDTTGEPKDETDAAAVPAAGDVAAEDAGPVPADAVSADAASDASPANAVDGGPQGTAEAVDPQLGSKVITEPEGASVFYDKRLLCKTPCTVTWKEDEEPPTVRIKLYGYIDIELTFGKSDRGTEQNIKLRPRP